MAFQQLYYTSCESGLAGYGGYQFNAVTPGISPVVMREVEERSVYEPPRWLLAEPCLDEPEAYPVAFSYAKSDATGAAIVIHVMFAGTDYSGRPGNYFAHALVTSTPEPDFGPLLPAELWGAELWRSTPVESDDLPELPGPLPHGVIDRPGVQAFLDARGTEAVLPELLTAVWLAMAGDRLVLLASHDANENIWWIAAVSYLLGEHLAPQMTFTTYSHRPGYSRHHLVGIESEAVPPDADSGFQLFDFDSGRTPGGVVHPLASLLAHTGVMAAGALWRQASAFASGSEKGPDDWVGPVAAAAGLLRGRLSPAETHAVVRWLPTAAARIPAQIAGVVLGVALDQPGMTFSDEQLVSLLELARRLRSPVQAERLENLMVKRAVAHVARGETAEPVHLGDHGAQSARAQVSDLLRTAAPAVALAALEWAAASGAVLPDAELEQYGRACLNLSAAEPELMKILRLFPATLRAMVAGLAQEPRQRAASVFASPVGGLISEADVAPYPGLAEERLLVLVDQKRMNPQDAYDPIVDLRIAAHQEPYVDVALLRRLWPTGCPAEQVVEILGVMAKSPDPDIRGWFLEQIQAAAARGPRSASWLRLARALADGALLPLLPGGIAHAVRSTTSAEAKLRQARDRVAGQDMSVFPELYAHYEATDPRDRWPVGRDLAGLLYEAEPLGVALRGCPVEVMAVFCERLQDWLDPARGDVRLAARVFTALADPDLKDQQELGDHLATAFEQVRGWKRQGLGAVGNLLSSDTETAQLFQTWRESRRGWLARKLHGGRLPAAEGP
jgi:hypothetical protein